MVMVDRPEFEMENIRLACLDSLAAIDSGYLVPSPTSGVVSPNTLTLKSVNIRSRIRFLY